jgi:hypothetical protein
MSNQKEWHHLVREDGSVSLYYTLPNVGAHFVVFDTLDALTMKELNRANEELNAELTALRQQGEALAAALGHYTNAEIVTDWGMEETEDDGEIARAALDAYRRGQGE